MEAYYTNQSKGGIVAEPTGFNRRKYNTNRYMGRGFFTNSVKPLIEKALPFVGRTLINTAQCFVDEVRKESGLFDVKGGGGGGGASRTINDDFASTPTVAKTTDVMGNRRAYRGGARRRRVRSTIGRRRRRRRSSHVKVGGGRKRRRRRTRYLF